MGWVGADMQICWPAPNPTHYKKMSTQPNPLTPKNRPNMMGSVGFGQFWQIGGLAAHPNWDIQELNHLFHNFKGFYEFGIHYDI